MNYTISNFPSTRSHPPAAALTRLVRLLPAAVADPDLDGIFRTLVLGGRSIVRALDSRHRHCDTVLRVQGDHHRADDCSGTAVRR